MGVKGSPDGFTWQTRHSGTVRRLQQEANAVRYGMSIEEVRLALIELRQTADTLAVSLGIRTAKRPTTKRKMVV